MTTAEALEIITNLTKMGASPGGLALLANLFTDHGITSDVVANAVKQLPVPPAPKGT